MIKTIARRKSEEVVLTTHPLLQRIYANRGVQTDHALERGLEHLLPYQTLKQIDEAAALLALAIKKQQRILIIGDFDADGATSTVVALRALREFGAEHVDYLVPNRFEFGYGLTPELVEVAKQRSPDLIVTVDNGIVNHDGVLAAKAAGISVIITDHHLPAETLPAADAIVNPNQVGDLFPSKSMAGVGVIFYVMLALRRFLINEHWFLEQKRPEPLLSKWLDLVALGTVADVVSLDHNNRILVYQGLRRIRAGHCVPGITALLEVAKRQPANLVAGDLGFAVGPRLNAAGRLDDMSLGIECLLCDDRETAWQMAQVLDQLNSERRVIEQEMQTQALAVLDALLLDKKKWPRGVCLFDETWHQGVIGLLASRIKDKLNRPVIVFALAQEGILKGSARSIPGLSIRDTLAELAVLHPGLIKKFGGHAMAAGLTIQRVDLDCFSSAFDELVTAKLGEEMMHHVILSDGELTQAELNLPIAELIKEAGPFGQSFPEPLFDGVFTLLDQYIVGGKHLKMNLAKEDQVIEAIAFNVNLNEWPNYRCQQVMIAYRLEINEFKGKKKIQLIVEQLVEH